jgi:hypothetical protein
MLQFTLQDTPETTYRCRYVESSDGVAHVSDECGGGPGVAFADRRDALKKRLARGLICYYKVRDNRGRTAEAGVCKGNLDKIVDNAIDVAAPVVPSFWERHGTKILVVGGALGVLAVGGVVYARIVR